MSPDPAAPKPSIGRTLLAWLARGVLAATLAAVVDLSCVLALSPLALENLGDWLGALALGAAAALPVASLLAVFVGLATRSAPLLGRLPQIATNVTVALTVVVVTAAIRVLHRRLGSAGFEFDAPLQLGLDVLSLFVVVVAAVAGFRYLHPWLSRFNGKASPVLVRAAVAAQTAGLALAAVAGCHFGPASTYDVSLAPAAAGAALALLLMFVAVLTPRMGGREALGVVAVGLTLGGLGVLLPRPGASYLAYSRGVATLALIDLDRRAVDWDSDGAGPVWLGGADCAPFDSERGPLQREVPGDGIDQDCRGGDASGLPESRVDADPSPWQACLEAPREQPLNIVLVTVEALRADAVNPTLTPWLAPYIQRAAWFHRAYAPSTVAEQSIPVLLSGEALSDLGPPNLHRSDDIASDNPAVVRLREAGYVTAALTTRPPQGQSAGFDYFGALSMDPPPLHGRTFGYYAGALSRGAVGYLRRARQPFLIWVHYTDTHAPYVPLSLGEITAQARNDYERAAAYTAFRIAELLRVLQQPELAQKTVVVLTAEHGEDLGERGRWGHGGDQFEAAIRVPLGLVVPGCPPLSVHQPVSLAELAPTLLQLAGLPAEGRTLFDSIAGRPRSTPVVVETWSTNRLRRAVMEGKYKLLVDVASGGSRLFDLEADPEENENLYGRDAEATERMEQAYQRWLDRISLPSEARE